MKTILSALLLLCCLTADAATTFTEFYCNSTGTNINSGSTTNATPTFSATAGDWVASTGVWTKAGANPVAGGVTVGAWASVYIDGATTAVFIGRVTAADDTADTITVSLAAATGIPPADGTATRSIRVGGAWYGPWTAAGATVDNLPFTFVNANITNTSGNFPRVNFSNSRVYGTTNVTCPSNGPFRFQGYATNANDLQKAVISGSTVGAGTTIITIAGTDHDFADLIWATNGAANSAAAVTVTGGANTFNRCVFRDSRGSGLSATGVIYANECEAFNCGIANTTGHGGYLISGAGSVLVRCIAHDNAGTGVSGFVAAGNSISFDSCIADTNGRDGMTLPVAASAMAYVRHCSFYNNVTNGINLTGATVAGICIENCEFFQNGVGLAGAYAINSSGSLLRNGSVVNCAFGTGTATNGSGGANIFPGTALDEFGSISLTANTTPWTDPANGNFTRSAAGTTINAGRGLFTETQASYSGTASFPDIGAAQITNSAAGGSTVISYPIFRR